MITNYFPDISILLQFAVASIILTITPGPDMALFLSRGINHGSTAGIMCMLGASTGVLIHTLFAAIGLSALLAASATAFTIVKLAGAAYLIWLAYQAIRHGSALNVIRDASAKPLAMKNHYLTGVGINLLNPKIVLFFVSFLPQFVQVDDPFAAEKLAFLGMLFLFIAIPMVIPMILAADWMADTLKKSRVVARTMDYLFAAVFGAFAVKILSTQAR